MLLSNARKFVLNILNQPEFPMIFDESPQKHGQTNNTVDGSEIPNNPPGMFFKNPCK